MKLISKLFPLFSLIILIAFVFVPSALALDCQGEVVLGGVLSEEMLAGCETVLINGMVTNVLNVSGDYAIFNGDESRGQVGVPAMLGGAQEAPARVGSAVELAMMTWHSDRLSPKVKITHGLSPPSCVFTRYS